MRAALVVVTLIAPFALGACATSNTPSKYEQDYNKLEAECRASGGYLAPTGSQTGRPQTDNVCKITGGASRLTNH